MAAMQSAVRTLLAEFDPAKLRLSGERGGLDLVPVQRKARAWDAFETLHAKVTQALADDFDSVFGKAFARAYEQALAEASAKEPAPMIGRRALLTLATLAAASCAAPPPPAVLTSTIIAGPDQNPDPVRASGTGRGPPLPARGEREVRARRCLCPDRARAADARHGRARPRRNSSCARARPGRSPASSSRACS